jgi:putative peptidoglycan lipid II flippase
LPGVTDEHRVVSSTRLIAALTLVSRLLGLAREIAYAQFLGAGPLLSAFRIAFMIPNLTRRLFGEGALSAAFIPVFTRALRHEDPNHAPRLAGGVLTLLTLVLTGVLLAAEIGLIISIAIRPSDTLVFTAIMLPFMVLICLAAFLGGVLNTLGRFGAPAAAPMLLNVFVIVAIVGGSYLAGWTDRSLVYAMCVAVLLAGFAQVALQVVALRATGFRPVLNTAWRNPDISKITAFMGPMIVGLSTVQVNTLLDMLIAWFFVPDGNGPAVLGYAHFLYQLPLGVFGIAIATATFPVLADRAARDDLAGVSRAFEMGSRLSFFVMLPATVGLMLVATPLVTTFLQHGAFGADDSARVSTALCYYTIGLCAYSMQHLVVRVFYATGDSRTPARTSVMMVSLNLILNLILVRRMGESGIALATASSAVVQVLVLSWILRRRLPTIGFRAFVRANLKTVVAAALMGVCVWLVVGGHSPIGLGDSAAWIKLALAVPLGGLVFFAAAHALGATEVAELLRSKRSSSR